MAETLTIMALLGGFCACVGAALAWADRRLPADTASVADAVDRLLPQTQCAQCGYPGCRPYAEAVADGAPIDLCPPGGEDTVRALGRLLGRGAGPPADALSAQVARIDEARCVGCFLCVQACPVDAIVGAPQLLHTVLTDDCTGCELCLEPCPVDCIDMVATNVERDPRPVRILARPRNREPAAPTLACIRCGACESSCPEHLLPQELHWYCRDGAWDEARARGLDRCIECGLCNQVCPSNIDLLAGFTRGREALAQQDHAARQADLARARFEQHEARSQARARARDARREQRLRASGTRPWQR